MFASIARATRQIFEPALLGLLVRSAVLTLLLFLIGLAGAEFIISRLPVLGNPWVNKALEILAPVMFVFLLGLLGAPVAALVGTIFLDKAASKIEARDYPQVPVLPARIWPAFRTSLRLTGMVLTADLLLLPLDIFLPGLGQILSLIANGWLLGWEYFELVAVRHLSTGAADALRHRQGLRVWLGGMLIAFLSAMPVLDLIAPVFGTALMVHLFHRLTRERAA